MQYFQRITGMLFINLILIMSFAGASQETWLIEEREEKSIPLLSEVYQGTPQEGKDLDRSGAEIERQDSLFFQIRVKRSTCDALNQWFESHVLHKDRSHRCQKNISKIIDGSFALSGSAVFVYLSYKFGNTTLKGGILGGLISSILSSISPVLGYGELNLLYYDSLLVQQDGRKQIAKRSKSWQEIGEEALMGISNLLGSLPIAYASHQSFLDLIDLGATWALDVPAFVSIYLIYDITTRKLLIDLKSFIYSKKLDIGRPPRVFNEKDARSLLLVQLQRLLSNTQSISDERINEIYDKVHQQERESINSAIDSRLISLLTDLSAKPQIHEVDQKENTKKKILGYVGGAIGLIGSYYFYEMGSQALVDMCDDVGISPSTSNILGIVSGSLAFGSRGVFSFITTQQTVKDLCGYVKDLCFGSKKQTIGQKILVPAALAVFAGARSIPNVQMSFDYLGMENWHELTLGACTALSTFSGSFWTLKAFTDAHFQTENQARREILKKEIQELIYITPYLKEEPLREILMILNYPMDLV